MKEHENMEDSRPLDYMVANLLDFFRDPRHEHRFFEAAKIAINQVSRMARMDTGQLEKRYLFFASKLKNNLSPASLRHFAHECLLSADKTGFISSASPKNVMPSMKTLQKRAHLQLTDSLAVGYSEASAIHRAANEMVKSKRELDHKERIKKMTSMHPLKDTLEVLNLSERPLAKEDIKSQLLRLKKKPSDSRGSGGVLYRLLERAQSFSTCRLHKLLGDELFFLCRPLGFMDQDATMLVVEVPTSAHLHALTYRKLDILRSLKKDATFRTLKNIRFKIKSGTF